MVLRRFKRILFFCLLLSAISSCVWADDERVRVATYNLENYLVMDRSVGPRWCPAYPKPENEKSMIRQVIRSVQPDILVLQEMGTVDFLEELRVDLAREGQHYTQAIHMSGTDPDRHLAILSKLKPMEVVKHRDLDFKYFEGRERVKRGMLEASFELGGGFTFKLFAVHLKSRYTDNKEDALSRMRRTGEAEACRNRIIERTHEAGQAHYIIAGDFNDHPKSAPLRRFYRRGDLEIGSLVRATDSRGEVWTYYYEKESRYELIDGFIASPVILSSIVAGSGRIADVSGVMTASDHRMVYLDINNGHGHTQAALRGSRNGSPQRF